MSEKTTPDGDASWIKVQFRDIEGVLMQAFYGGEPHTADNHGQSEGRVGRVNPGVFALGHADVLSATEPSVEVHIEDNK